MNARTILRSALTLVAALFVSVSANAQLFRAYLASDGNDANPCNLPAPCRLLPAALSAVASGGEIWMLDSANYNTATVTIGKSVSILAVPGAVGSVLAIGGPAISITAGSLSVALRNLVIVPLVGGGGTNGVQMTGASSLTIEDSLFANLPDSGVAVTGSGAARITNSIFRSIFYYAVSAQNGATVSISHSKMLGNYTGVFVLSTAVGETTATISDSVMSGGSSGVYAYATITGGKSRIFVTRSTIDDAFYGLNSATYGSLGSSLVSVSGSMITNNYYAWYQSSSGSVIKTMGNNHIQDNTTFLGVLTPASLQ